MKIHNYIPTADQLNECIGYGKSTEKSKAAFSEGSSVEILWNSTVTRKLRDHGVRIAVSFEKKNFIVLANGININDQRATIKLPVSNSGPAILQWMWTSKQDGGFYMICSDVEVNPKSNPKATKTRSIVLKETSSIKSSGLKKTKTVVLKSQQTKDSIHHKELNHQSHKSSSKRAKKTKTVTLYATPTSNAEFKAALVVQSN
ncbi:hypothetical protein HK096_000515 [Nowakowskiella sp. JEL0078]|nr:hypothetical protein HK096_000515 [Nowakowskiella sp. JEL0078]